MCTTLETLRNPLYVQDSVQSWVYWMPCLDPGGDFLKSLVRCPEILGLGLGSLMHLLTPSFLLWNPWCDILVHRAQLWNPWSTLRWLYAILKGH